MQPNQPMPAPAPLANAVPVQTGGSNYSPSSPAVDAAKLQSAKAKLDEISTAFTARVVGQANLHQSLLVALLTNGHVLMESVPGLAKTTAASTIASAIGGTFHRIQCTPDLLPSDIMGTQLYDQSKSQFVTQLGPVNANFVLLDEINRSSAKTQSAMLEAMQERQLSIGGKVYELPEPFLVLATQNPIEQEGTYELPEAQLDRFLLKEVITYPTADEELEILHRIENGVYREKPSQTNVSVEDIVELQSITNQVYVDERIKQYVVQIVQASRNPASVVPAEQARYVQYGASPRAAIAFMQAGRALALLSGRDYVIPDDIKALRHTVLRHRIILNFEAIADNVHQEAIIDAIVSAIAVP
jgi:MoxR-like ATPase